MLHLGIYYPFTPEGEVESGDKRRDKRGNIVAEFRNIVVSWASKRAESKQMFFFVAAQKNETFHRKKKCCENAIFCARNEKQTLESSQHCLLREQTGKHLSRRQNVSEKIRNICFRNNVSATMFPRLLWALRELPLFWHKRPINVITSNFRNYVFKISHGRFIYKLVVISGRGLLVCIYKGGLLDN